MYRVRGEVFDRVVDELGTTSGRGRPARVLDVGAGTGFYVDRWLARKASVTGVDLTEVSVRNLRERFPAARFIQADIGAPLGPPLADEIGTFDVVSAFDVLFH